MPNHESVSNSESKKTDKSKPRFSVLNLTFEENLQCHSNIGNDASFIKIDEKENYPQMTSIIENKNGISILDQSSFHVPNNDLDSDENFCVLNNSNSNASPKSNVNKNNLNISMWSMNESESNEIDLDKSLPFQDYNENDNIIFNNAHNEDNHNDSVDCNINDTLSKEMSYETRLFSYKKDISEDKSAEYPESFDRSFVCQNIQNSIISGITELSYEPAFIYNSDNEDQSRYEDAIDSSEKSIRVSIDVANDFEKKEFRNQFSALEFTVMQKYSIIENDVDLKTDDFNNSSIFLDNYVLENEALEKTIEKDEIFLFDNSHVLNKNIFDNQSQQFAFHDHLNDGNNNNSVCINNFDSNGLTNIDEFINISPIVCKNASTDMSNGKYFEKTDSVDTDISGIDIRKDLNDKNSFISMKDLNFNYPSNIQFVNNENLNQTVLKDLSIKTYEYESDNAPNHFGDANKTNKSDQCHFQIQSYNEFFAISPSVTNQVQGKNKSPLYDSFSSTQSDCLSSSFDFGRNGSINTDASLQSTSIVSNETLSNKLTGLPLTDTESSKFDLKAHCEYYNLEISLNAPKQKNSINHSHLPLQSIAHFKPSGTNFSCQSSNMSNENNYQSVNSNNIISRISQQTIEDNFVDNLVDNLSVINEDESFEENDLNKAIYFEGNESFSGVIDDFNQSRVNDEEKLDSDASPDDSSNLNDFSQNENASKSKQCFLTPNDDKFLMDMSNSQMDNNCNNSEQINELIQDNSDEIYNGRDNKTSNKNTSPCVENPSVKESSKVPSKYFEETGNTDGSIFINLSDISKQVSNNEYLKTNLSTTNRENFSHSSIESRHIPFNNFDANKSTEDENDVTIENVRNNSSKLHGNSQINLTTPMNLSIENMDLNFSKCQKVDLNQSSFTTNSSFKLCQGLKPANIFNNTPKHIYQSRVSNFETPINLFNSHVYSSTVRNTNNLSKKPRMTDVLSTPTIDSVLSSRITYSTAKLTKPKLQYYSIDTLVPPQKSELRSFDINVISENCKSILSCLRYNNIVPKSKNIILKPKKRETFSNVHPEIARLYVLHIGIPRLKLMYSHKMKLEGLIEKFNRNMNHINSLKSKLLSKCIFCSNQQLCSHYNYLKQSTEDLVADIYGEYSAIMQSCRFSNDQISKEGAYRVRLELAKMTSQNKNIIQEHNHLKFQNEHDQEISKMKNQLKASKKLCSQFSKIVSLNSERRFGRWSDKSEEEKIKERYEFIIRKKISPLQEQIISPCVTDFLLMGSRVTIRSLIRPKDNEICIESATVTVNDILFPLNVDIQHYFQAFVNDSVVNCSKAQAKEMFLNSQVPILLLYGDVKLCSKFRKLTFYPVPDKPFVLKAQIISIGSMLIRFAIIFDLNPISTYQHRPLNYHIQVEFDNVDVPRIRKVIEETEDGLNKLYRLFERLFLELPGICLNP